MAKPFRLPAWRKNQIEEKYRRKRAVASSAAREINRVLERATESIIEQAIRQGRFVEPDLSELDQVGKRFYLRVIESGWRAAAVEEREIKASSSKQRLANLPKGRIRPLEFLVDLFKDQNTWPSILKRSQTLMDRLRRGYLRKIKRKFEEVVPRMLSGEASPSEVKKELTEAWQASHSRVENIFRTETTRYFTETQLSYFGDSDEIIGFLFDSVGDSGRSPWCTTRHGLVYRPGTELLRKNAPPCHWSCRSHLIPLANTESNRRLLADPDRDPAHRTVEPLPAGWER
jgi:SPP1 gp7 family putative phage head morphogenesis protein